MLLLKERIDPRGARPRLPADARPRRSRRATSPASTSPAPSPSGSASSTSIQGSYFQTRSLRLALRAGEPFRIALALGWEAVHSACQGRAARRRTARLIAARRGRSRAASATPTPSAWPPSRPGAADYLAGRFPAAVELLDRAAGSSARSAPASAGSSTRPRSSGSGRASTRGEFAELSSRFQALDQEARERGDRYMESTLGTYPGVLARLAADQPGEARDLGEGAIAAVVAAAVPRPAPDPLLREHVHRPLRRGRRGRLAPGRTDAGRRSGRRSCRGSST